jgi:hypothetical protein
VEEAPALEAKQNVLDRCLRHSNKPIGWSSVVEVACPHAGLMALNIRDPEAVRLDYIALHCKAHPR